MVLISYVEYILLLSNHHHRINPYLKYHQHSATHISEVMYKYIISLYQCSIANNSMFDNLTWITRNVKFP